jgi:acyl-CoA synthetase (AMP-forming)/AMP-acid ligase II
LPEPNASCELAELIRWRARRHPDLEAIWCAGKSQSYGALNESTSQLASALVKRLSIAPGDRVGILDKNCQDYLELVLALDKAGAVAAPINRRQTAH